jgi:phosphohistidine phosphatase
MSKQPLSSGRFLIVMRHAKSDWSDAGLSDHDRVLNERGKRDAPRMARWLAEVALVPDLILCSTAQRTQETADLMKQQWSPTPTISLTAGLYLATHEQILRTIRSDGCGAERLMVLAHNPGVTEFVSRLSRQPIDMPTAAIAVFELPLDDWSELSETGSAKLVHYMRPKAL